MNLKEAVEVLRAGKTVSFESDDAQEQLVWEYLLAAFKSSQGDKESAQSIVAKWPQDEASAIARLLFEARFLHETSNTKSEKILQKIERQNLRERARLNPGPFHFWEIEVLFYSAYLACYLRKYEKGIEYYKEHNPIAEEHGVLSRLGIGKWGLANCYLNTGRYREYQHSIIDMEKFVGEKLFPPAVHCMFLMSLAEHAMIFGKYAYGLSLLDQTQTFYEQFPLRDDRLAIWVVKAVIQCRMADFAAFENTLTMISQVLVARGVSPWDEAPPILKIQQALRRCHFQDVSRILASVQTDRLHEYLFPSKVLAKIELAVHGIRKLSVRELKSYRKFLETSPEHLSEGRLALYRYDLKFFGPTKKLQTTLKNLQTKLERFGFVYEILLAKRLALEIQIVRKDRQQSNEAFHAIIQYSQEKGYTWDEFLYRELFEIHFKKTSPSARLQQLRASFSSCTSPLANLWPYSEITQNKNDIWLDFDWQKNTLLKDGKELIKLPKSGRLIRLLKLLVSKNGNSVDFAKIVTAVWNEQYNPLIHDMRIYQIVRDLRNFFESHNVPSKVFENIPGEGYRICLPQREIKNSRERIELLQDWVLRFSDDDPINPQLLLREFGYSLRQAQRDLAALCNLGVLKPHGGKRNRFYTRLIKNRRKVA